MAIGRRALRQVGRWALIAGTAGGAGLLAACGGGGGVQSTPTPTATATPTPTPTPVPTPTPTPTPTPVATSYDTTEYRQTLGAVDMNALAAYQRGATGAGIAVGIIDTGIDLASAEFGSRISSASSNVAGGTTIQDEGGHGTAVAFTLAGRRNGTGTHGVAFDATLVVERADTPGTCAGTTAGSDASSCSLNDASIVKGIDAARLAGARVINMSLGTKASSDGAGPTTDPAFIAAINRATAAGIVIVISAGNDAAANPNPFAEVANNAAARGLVVVAGSVNAPVGYQNTTGQAGTPGALSSFSDQAGDAAGHYIAAVGTRVPAPDNTGTSYLWTGTSFSAPQVSAAAALLAQAYPNLSGAQIVALLFASARDAGAAGVDPVYGNGILDLTRAFQPVGTTSLAGSTVAASLTANGTTSAPMGDAQGTLGAVVLDGFGRAFAADLARTLRAAGPVPTLAASLATRTRNVRTALGSGTTLAVTLDPRPDGSVDVVRSGFAPQIVAPGRATAALVTQRMGERAQLAFGLGYGGAALVAALAGEAQPAFLLAADPRGVAGFDSRSTGASAIRRRIAGFGVTAAAEAGEVRLRDPALPDDPRLPGTRWRYGRFEIALDRRLGALSASLGGTMLREGDTVLGARLGAALGSPHATSWFLDAGSRLAPGGGWSAGASWREGWTGAVAAGPVAGAGLLRTRAWAADVGKDGVFGRADSIGLRVAQPLRVAGGGITYRMPTAYDYASLSVSGWTDERLNLSPTGRELDVEARYARPLDLGALAGDVGGNLFWRRDPGNIAALAPDYGIALRWSLGF